MTRMHHGSSEDEPPWFGWYIDAHHILPALLVQPLPGKGHPLAFVFLPIVGGFECRDRHEHLLNQLGSRVMGGKPLLGVAFVLFPGVGRPELVKTFLPRMAVVEICPVVLQ